MPRQGGLELYEQLVREGKRLPVIFITAHADVTTAVAAMKSGAIEFLEKPFDHETLRDRITKALALDADWRRREAEFNAVAQRIARLNDRERETLELILAGAANKVMASRLFISERAVEMHRARIMHKLQVNSLAELVDLAVTHRLLSENLGAFLQFLVAGATSRDGWKRAKSLFAGPSRDPRGSFLESSGSRSRNAGRQAPRCRHVLPVVVAEPLEHHVLFSPHAKGKQQQHRCAIGGPG